MTLLLSLVGKSGIHLSSDFRLTDISTRKPIEDVFGSKQLHFSFQSFTAYVSFTGIAQVGPLRTVDWVSQTMFGLSQSITVEDAILELANAATAQFRNLPKQLRQLTMVIAVVLAQKPARLVVVTCNENPHGPALAEPLEQFAIYEFGTDRPEVFLYGYTGAVSSADRKFLKKLNRNESPEEVRAALARVNARSAKNSNGTISAGCLVTSILPGGHSELQNFGGYSRFTSFCARRKKATSANTSRKATRFRSRPRSPNFGYPNIDDEAYEHNQGTSSDRHCQIG